MIGKLRFNIADGGLGPSDPTGGDIYREFRVVIDVTNYFFLPKFFHFAHSHMLSIIFFQKIFYNSDNKIEYTSFIHTIPVSKD